VEHVIEYDLTAGEPVPTTDLFVIYDAADGRVVSFHGFVGDVSPQGERERERAALESTAKSRKRENLAALRIPSEFEFEPGAVYKVALQSRSLEVARPVGGGLAPTQAIGL
jgi:hypothetical protein